MRCKIRLPFEPLDAWYTYGPFCLKIMQFGIWVFTAPLYNWQEAMENFVFPHEILPNLMRMTTLMNIFYVPLNYAKSQQSCTSFYWHLFLCTTFTSTFRGQNMELLSCKERHFQLWLVDFHVQKVSSNLSKWFLHTPWTTKWCQTRYLKSRGLYI